jgi:hypothetical protein
MNLSQLRIGTKNNLKLRGKGAGTAKAGGGLVIGPTGGSSSSSGGTGSATPVVPIGTGGSTVVYAGGRGGRPIQQMSR